MPGCGKMKMPPKVAYNIYCGVISGIRDNPSAAVLVRKVVIIAWKEFSLLFPKLVTFFQISTVEVKH
jgi:hypothetical protein